jgi:hypothetical protein
MLQLGMQYRVTALALLRVDVGYSSSTALTAISSYSGISFNTSDDVQLSHGFACPMATKAISLIQPERVIAADWRRSRSNGKVIQGKSFKVDNDGFQSQDPKLLGFWHWMSSVMSGEKAGIVVRFAA